VAMSTSLPLKGYRVLVTRAHAQAGALTGQLERLGATVIELPAIDIVPADPAPLDAAIRAMVDYDWIVFTSANGVSAFDSRLRALGLDPMATAGVRIAAIGKATAGRLRDAGYNVDLMPDRFIAESFVDVLAGHGVGGKRILLPQAEIARDAVAVGLRAAGAIVDVVVAYRTVVPDGYDEREVRGMIAGLDIVTFASPSSVRHLLAMAGGELPDRPVVCIGPVTADAAREAGLAVAAVADTYTTEGLSEALVRLVERAEKEVPDGRYS
jgi:uroporphyrinogen III methyltransferase / synthase